MMIPNLRAFVFSVVAVASMVLSLPLSAQQVDLTAPHIENKFLNINDPITILLPDFRYPTSSPPDEYLIYDLPSGLDFDKNTRVISGTPDKNQIKRVTYRAKKDGFLIDSIFTITVADLSAPVAPAESINLTFEPLLRINKVLPAFKLGNGALTHSLTDDSGPVTSLIAGLSYNPNSRTISGTGPGTPGNDSVPAATYTYSATDQTPTTSSITVTISVKDSIPRLADASIPFRREVRLFQSIDYQLPRTAGRSGDVALRYTIEPGLPAGLYLRNYPLNLSGTHYGTNKDDNKELTYDYIVTDRDGDRAVREFRLTIIDNLPDFGDSTIEDISAVEDTAITTVTLPALMDGTWDSTVTYSIAGPNGAELPNGLSFNNDDRMLSGTPAHDAAIEPTTYTYTATDRDGDTATIEFTIAVTDDPEPIAPVLPNSSFNFTPGQVFSETLPIFTSGNGKLTYSIRNSADETVTDLVAGLSFDPETRIISGTVPATSGNDSVPTTTYFYAATDSDPQNPDTESVPFTITVTDLEIEPVTVKSFFLTPGENVNRMLPLFTISNGDPLTHRLTLADAPDTEVTDLVAGLKYKPDTNTISGTVPATSGDDKVEATTYHWSATNPDPDDPDTSVATFTITVKDKMPDLTDVDFPNIPGIRVNVEGTLPIPPAVSGDLPITYSFEPDLPNGLTLFYDPNTPDRPEIRGEVTGTPMYDGGSEEDETYRYVATDADGDRTFDSFRLRVIDYLPSFGTETIDNITIVAGTELNLDSPLPEVIAGESDGDITYSLTGPEHDPLLPTGLMFDPKTRVLSGTPNVGLAETTYSYRATDADGDTAILTFNITVESDTLTAPTLANAALTFYPGQMVDITLRDFNGGNRPLNYSLSPAFPDSLGLSFIPETRTIEGTVSGSDGDDDVATTSYTYMVTDQTDAPASTTFTITVVDTMPDFGSETISDFRAVVDTAITTVTLPQVATVGTKTTTYTLVGPNDTPRPAWLDFDGDTRELSGTPGDTDTGSTTLTYIATDADGDTATLTFTILVKLTNIEIVAPTVSPLIFTPGHMDATNTLPAFMGGDGILTHSLSVGGNTNENLPGGISFDPDSRTLTIPADSEANDSLATTTFTYAAEDEDGDTAMVPLSITVVDTRPVVPQVDNLKFLIGVNLGSLHETLVTLPEFTLSTMAEYPDVTGPDLTLTLTHNIPWLTFDPDTRRLSGRPDMGGTTTVTYTATDGADTASETFNIRVSLIPVAPINPLCCYTFTVGQDYNGAIAETLPEFTSGDGILTYSLIPALPDGLGLTFTPADRTISGMVVGTASDDSISANNNLAPLYTFIATDEDGERKGIEIIITIKDEMPDFSGVDPIENISAIVDSPITAVQLPETTGTGTVDYSLSPTLPAGLTFNEDGDRMLSGTPTSGPTPAPVTFTYTATDQDRDFDTLTFTITVAADLKPMIPTPTIAPFVFVVEQAAQDVSEPLALFTSGNGMLTYTLSNSPDLTTMFGLMFEVDNQNRPMITGRIPADTNGDASVMATTYTYTATDENSDSVSTPITIQIIDPIPVAPSRVVVDPFTRNAPYSFRLPPFTTNVDNNDDGVTVPALTYSLSNHPTWLSIHATDHIISGMPPADAALSPRTVTYIANEVGGMDSATITFDLISTDDPAPLSPTIPNGGYTFTVGHTGTIEMELPAFTIAQGNTIASHRLIVKDDNTNTAVTSLVGGLMYDQNSRTVSGDVVGTPNPDGVTETYTYTATDADTESTPDSNSVDFTITIVDEAPDFTGVDPIENISAIVDSAITTVTLPQVATAGTNTTTYSLTLADGTAHPQWLKFDANSRELSGTPGVDDRGPINLTYTATDEDEDSDDLTFTITVAEDLMPAALTVQNFVYVVRQSAQRVTAFLPGTTGGNGELTYSLTDGTNPVTSLVGDLSYNPMNRIILGEIPADTAGDESDPTDVNAPAMFTYSATDEDGDPATTDFTIQIIDPRPVAPDTIAPVEFALNINNTSRQLLEFGTNIPTGSSITPPTFTYRLYGPDSTGLNDPALPDGLMFDSNTRVLSGIPTDVTDPANPITLTYRADEEGGMDFATQTFAFSVTDDPMPIAPDPLIDHMFTPGQDLTAIPVILPAFTISDSSIMLEYSLSDGVNTNEDLEFGLTFNPASRSITGMVPLNATDGSRQEFTYSATEIGSNGDGDMGSGTFTITITDAMPAFASDGDAAITDITSTVGTAIATVTLPEVETGGTGTTTYSLVDPDGNAPANGLTFNVNTRELSGTPTAELPLTTFTYRATDEDGDTATITFTITVLGDQTLGALEEVTASALPSVGANIALVASQAISSRIELALDGLTQGVDIRTLDGTQFRLNPSVQSNQQNGGSSGSSVRFGVWFSAASDTLTDARSDLTWNGTTDSTNIGFDVGFDISESGSLVVGILQNSSSTSATYNNTAGGGDGTLSVDLDSTAFYVGIGYEWLDAWFANGSADSILDDSRMEDGIPTSFAYQTIGLTASFEVIDSLSIGAKVESLTSDLSLASMTAIGYDGLVTDSSQLRTTFVANYQLKVGDKGNGLLMPKFEFGFRDLSLNSSIQGPTTAAGGSAMETGFGVDYFQKAWGLTLGLDIRSISVENYSSDSTQWQVRWESGNYGSGISFGLKPHSAVETLGGIDSLYSGNYNQYQSLLQRQRGGNATQDTKGMDFEVGYGIATGHGTVTPYLKTSNFRGSGNRGDTLGIRYQTLSGLELTVKAERERTPQTTQLLGLPSTFTQQEHALTLNTRYSF